VANPTAAQRSWAALVAYDPISIASSQPQSQRRTASAESRGFVLKQILE